MAGARNGYGPTLRLHTRASSPPAGCLAQNACDAQARNFLAMYILLGLCRLAPGKNPFGSPVRNPPFAPRPPQAGIPVTSAAIL